MNPKTHFCPRCKQDRLKEWFGDPKAPYAICLSCRVEVNSEQKEAHKTGRDLNCAICEVAILQGELCKKCEAGLSCFDNKPRLLGRAESYISGKLRRPTRRQKLNRLNARKLKIRRLVNDQRNDSEDRYLRFEHAIFKR